MYRAVGVIVLRCDYAINLSDVAAIVFQMLPVRCLLFHFDQGVAVLLFSWKIREILKIIHNCYRIELTVVENS